MTQPRQPLPTFLAEPSRIGTEISVTGKWVPTEEGGLSEAYFFRGPVSWTIRMYSKILYLPATYSSRGSNFTQPGGSMSDGTTV